MTEKTDQRRETRRLPKVDSKTAATHGGRFLGGLLGGMLSKVVIGVVLALAAAYFGAVKLAHFNPFVPHTTISTTVVLGKLIKIEQAHVATRSYPVDVKITQSVGIIPCFLICNQMELKGSGTDDAIVDLRTLTAQNVNVDQASATVTVWMPPPTIGPSELNAASCNITGNHGVINGATQGFRSNPNGYRPLYAQAYSQVHNAALHDSQLISAGEQSTRTLLTQILGLVGVKRVVVNFT